MPCRYERGHEIEHNADEQRADEHGRGEHHVGCQMHLDSAVHPHLSGGSYARHDEIRCGIQCQICETETDDAAGKRQEHVLPQHLTEQTA